MASRKARGDERKKQQLFEACQHGAWRDVVHILNRGCHLKVADKDHFNPMHYACLGNNEDVLRGMLQEKLEKCSSNLYEVSRQDETPLMMACRLGHKRMVEMLFSACAKRDVPNNSEGDTPLHVACTHGHKAVVELLLDLRPSTISARNCYDDTPLHKAIKGDHISVVKVLLKHGADVTVEDRFGWNAVHLSANEENWKIMKLVLKKTDIEIDAKDILGRTALSIASSRSNPKIVDALLACGADPNIVDGRDTSPLHNACMSGNVAIVKSLLEVGANVNAVNKSENKPLGIACSYGQEEILRLLLDHDALLTPEDTEEALTRAIALKQHSIIQMLADHLQKLRPKGVCEMVMAYVVDKVTTYFRYMGWRE